MAEFINKDEEQRRWEEAKKYADERQAQIDEERVNGRAKRQRQDKLFQKAVLFVFAVVLILLVISWAR